MSAAVSWAWRGGFANREVNALHAAAFDTRVFSDAEWDWVALVERHSVGWVTARDEAGLLGFVNVPWDGFVHAWLQDVMVAARAARRGVGTQLVAVATQGARAAGCEYLHVDFEEHLREFYLDACGFQAAPAGLLRL